MSRSWPGIASLAMATMLLSCSNATEPRGSTDVDSARIIWLARQPRVYSFEVATESSWFPRSGYYRVQVSDGQVVAARDSSGQAVPDFTITVDGIWDELLAARASNELNSARFDLRGVPLEADMGPWAVDGGRRYSVRNFAASR